MSCFSSRISAVTLLAAAVAWMLTLPLVFPSGRESGVAALPALQGLPDLRIVAPGWIFAQQHASGTRAARAQEGLSILLDPQDAFGHGLASLRERDARSSEDARRSS